VSVIVIVGPNLPGGQAVQVRALADGLRSDGYAVRVVPIYARFPRALRHVRKVRYLRTLLNEALYIASLHELRRADVVHIFSASYWSFLLAPVPAIVAAKMLGKPVVLHYHSGEAADHLQRWGAIVAPFLRMVNAIVVPSAYLQSVFASYGYATRVVPNVIDTHRFGYRERRSLRPRLLSARNLESHYRVDNTLRAFALLKERFPESTLTVAGAGTEESRLRAMAPAGVQFAGSVDPESLPALYADADIFVNSSVVDNQPVSILEAFSAGLPVISTGIGDIPSMLRNGEAGVLVPADDPRATADAIARLIEAPDLAARIARRAREEVERYTWPSVRALWRDVYAA